MITSGAVRGASPLQLRRLRFVGHITRHHGRLHPLAARLCQYDLRPCSCAMRLPCQIRADACSSYGIQIIDGR